MSAVVALSLLGGQTLVNRCSYDWDEVDPDVVEEVAAVPSSVTGCRVSISQSASEPATNSRAREFLRYAVSCYHELRFQLRMVFQPANQLAFLDAFNFEESCLPEEIQYEYTFQERTRLAEQLRLRVGAELRHVVNACACARCRAFLTRPRSAETILSTHCSRVNSLAVQNSLFAADEIELDKDTEQLVQSRDLSRTSLNRTSFGRMSLKRSGSLPELWQVPERVGVDVVAELETAASVNANDVEDADQTRQAPTSPTQADVEHTFTSVAAEEHHDLDSHLQSHADQLLKKTVAARDVRDSLSSKVMPVSNSEDIVKFQKSLDSWCPTSSLQVQKISPAPQSVSFTKGIWNGRVVMKKSFQLHASDPLLKERFLWEAAVTHALDHPNILKLYTCEVMLLRLDSQAAQNKSSGDAYPALWQVTRLEEHYDCTLSHAMSDGTLGVTTSWQLAVVQILLDVASGLQELHAHNIFYCYLHPGNIALNCSYASANLPPVFTAKIGDLQCSRFVSQHHANGEGIPISSDLLKYVAPEVLQSKAESAAADVYSLGVLLWEMLWGDASRNASSLGLQSSDALQQLLHLARTCLIASPQQRPQITHVVDCLKNTMVSVLCSCKPWN